MREACLKAIDICVTLCCHLAFQFKLVTSGTEEMELVSVANITALSSSTAPTVDLL